MAITQQSPYLDNFNAGAVARNTAYQDELDKTVARLQAMGYQASGNVTPGGSNSAYQLPNTGTLTLNGMQIPYAGANLQGDPVGWAQTQLSNYKAFGPGSEYGSNYFADSNPATGELPSYQGPTPTSAYNPSAPGPAWNPSTNAYQAPPPPNLDPYVQALSRMQQAIPRRFGSAQPDQSSQQIVGPSPLDQQQPSTTDFQQRDANQQQYQTGGGQGWDPISQRYQTGADQTQFAAQNGQQQRYRPRSEPSSAPSPQWAGWYKGGGYSGSTPAAEGRQAAPTNPFSASLFPAAGGTRTRQSTTANKFGVNPVSTTKGFGGI